MIFANIMQDKEGLANFWKKLLHKYRFVIMTDDSFEDKLSFKLNRLNVMFDTLHVNSKERVVIDNLDLNSWTNVTAVLDNTSVGIYLNGRLEKTITIRYNLEKIDTLSKMYICQNGGFAGYLSYVQAYQTPLEPDAVYNIYKNFFRVVLFKFFFIYQIRKCINC